MSGVRVSDALWMRLQEPPGTPHPLVEWLGLARSAPSTIAKEVIMRREKKNGSELVDMNSGIV